MSEPIDDMVESLKAFVECKHTYWECTQCHCRTNAGTVASPWRTKVNEIEQECERLQAELCDAQREASELRKETASAFLAGRGSVHALVALQQTEIERQTARIAELEAALKHSDLEAAQCAAMRDALLTRLVWSNHNGSMAYVLRGVNDTQLASVIVDAANLAAKAMEGRDE